MPDISSRGTPVFDRGVCFLDADAVVAQRDQGGDVWRISVAPAPQGPWTKVYDKGASVIAAGQGRWVAFLSGTGVFGPQGVLFGSSGATMGLAADIQACRGKAAPDGTIALIKNYQTSRGLRLYALDGTFVDVDDAQPFGQVAVIDKTRAAWWDLGANAMRTCGGLPVPKTLTQAFWPSVFQVNGAWWIGYHSSNDAIGLVLHPFDSFTGYRLATPPAFYPLMVTTSAGVVAAWATNPADSTGSAKTIDFTAPRIDLTTLGASTAPPVAPPPAPQPSPPPEPTPMTTPNYLADANAIAAQHPDLVKANTTAACGTLTELIAAALYAKDPNIGLLSKSPGEHQWNGHAVDALIYRATNQVIDLMSGAGDRDPDSGVPLNEQFDIRLKWDFVPKRDGNNWMQPIGVTAPPVEPPPVQPPPVTPDDADLKLRVGALEAALEHILATLESDDARLRTLEAVKPPVVPDLSAFARKGDKVTVKVPILGPAHGSIDQ